MHPRLGSGIVDSHSALRQVGEGVCLVISAWTLTDAEVECEEVVGPREISRHLWVIGVESNSSIIMAVSTKSTGPSAAYYLPG